MMLLVQNVMQVDLMEKYWMFFHQSFDHR